MELEASLSEAGGALEQEENKVLRCQLELTQVKKEVEQRIHQKEEEFASTKKNFGKALEGMQMALEAETKGKVEALRMKKKLEADVMDLGIALEHASAANTESQKNIMFIHHAQVRFEEENRAKAIARDNLIAADRRCNANQNALKESRTLPEEAQSTEQSFITCTNGKLRYDDVFIFNIHSTIFSKANCPQSRHSPYDWKQEDLPFHSYPG